MPTPSLDAAALLGQLTGYGLSVTLSITLAVLAWCSPGVGRTGRSIFAGCAALWSLGGLFRCVLLASGFAARSAPVAWMECLALSAAALWPVSLSMLWSGKDELTSAELKAGAWLVRIAAASGVLLIFAIVTWVAPGRTSPARAIHATFSVDGIPMLVAYNAAALMLAGFVLARRHLRSGPKRIGMTLMLLGPVLSVAAELVLLVGGLPSACDAIAGVFRKQSVILTILGGLFFLGRFRAADRFARLSLRIVLAWGLGVLIAASVAGPLARLAAQTAVPDVTSFAGLCALVAGGVLVFSLLGRITDRWVERHVFGKVELPLALTHLREDLSREETPAGVLLATEQFVAKSLQLEARLVAGAGQAEAGTEHFPVRVGDAETYVLAPRLGASGRSLLSGEIDVLRQVAELVGRRLEALDRERERLARSQREAQLVHQLVTAELRALRAQINPHFLFNSLNTIAALVHQEPAVAEGMTLRLAKIFRHVLLQTDHPFSSLDEEMQFLQAYLDIEQIRFGARLKVEFDVADSIRHRPVPALLLQPLVENAIKHGLAPKLGECRLSIGGWARDEQLVLRVQDNGVGVRGEAHHSSTGIGLRNIRDRLAALYGERARLSFESEPRSGSCATVYLPLTAA